MRNHGIVLCILCFTESKTLHSREVGVGWGKDQAGLRIPDCTPTAVLLLYLFLYLCFVFKQKEK